MAKKGGALEELDDLVQRTVGRHAGLFGVVAERDDGKDHFIFVEAHVTGLQDQVGVAEAVVVSCSSPECQCFRLGAEFAGRGGEA